MKVANEPDLLSKTRAEHRALAVLRSLKAMPAYRSNELVLGDLLDRLGITSTHEEVRGCLRWLDDCAALTIDMQDTLMVVQLTCRGGEASDGVIVIDGVRRPGPECPY